MSAQKHEQPKDKEFATLIDLLAVHSEAQNRMKELQTEINNQYLECVDDHKKEYADLQTTLANAESAIKLIAINHPEWFESKKNLKTPYGEVKQTTSTTIEISNPELTLALLKQEGKLNKSFFAHLYIRTVTSIRVEALEGMDDATLARFGAKRVQTKNYNVKAIEVDLGKAVEKEEKKEVA